MKPIAFAVIKSGLVSHDLMEEIRRWGLPVQLIAEDKVLQNSQQIVGLIRAALEGEDQIRVSETDLDVLARYLDPKHRQQGTLVAKAGDQKSSSKVTYCITPLGEYAIPWVSESIADLMINGETYLRFKGADGKNVKVFFTDVREVFFGENKAFMVCSPGAV